MYSSIVSYFIFVIESLSDWKRPPLDGSIWLQDSTMKDSMSKKKQVFTWEGKCAAKTDLFLFIFIKFMIVWDM